MRRLMFAAGAAFLTAISSGAIASSAPLVSFSPPPGWTAISVAGAIGAWRSPDRHQSLNLVASAPIGATLEDETSESVRKLRATFRDFTLGVNQPTTVCGGHPARYIAYIATVIQRALFQQVITRYGAISYVATYTRPVGQPSDHAARYALTTICSTGAGGALPAPAPKEKPAKTGPAASPSPTPTPAGPTPVPIGPPAPTITPRSGY